MGTDIHPHVEVRKNGKWTAHRPTTPYRYAGQWEGAPKFSLPDYFSNRNYHLFAALADVRNEIGMFGSGAMIEQPLTSNRGLPADLAPGSKAWAKEIDHSEGYATLKEIEEYNWAQTMLQQGVISEAQFLNCLWERRNPEGWSGGITGKDIVVLTGAEYIELFGQTNAWGDVHPGTRTYDPTKRYFIRHEWAVVLMEYVSEIREIVAYLQDLIPDGGTSEDVRLLFHFDS